MELVAVILNKSQKLSSMTWELCIFYQKSTASLLLKGSDDFCNKVNEAYSTRAASNDTSKCFMHRESHIGDLFGHKPKWHKTCYL